MAELAHQFYVIMGKPRNRPGDRGLVSTLADMNDMLRSGKPIEHVKKRMSMALGNWAVAKPDWRFDLVEVPKYRDYPVRSGYHEAMEALYNG